MLPDITNYIPDPNNGRPIANGQVYFFIDGYTPPTNINDVDPAYVAEVTAGGAALPQPIYTTQGGVLRTGSLANMPQVNVSALVKRVAVYDKCGALIYSTAYNGIGAFVDADALAAADSGVLVGGIEAQYVRNGAVLDNVAEMLAAGLPAGSMITLSRYYSGGDLVDGLSYKIKTAAQAVTDGDVADGRINHTLANGNIAVLQVVNAVHVKAAGAYGDNVNDDYDAIQAVFAYVVARNNLLNCFTIIDFRGGKSRYGCRTYLNLKGTNGGAISAKNIMLLGDDKAEIINNDPNPRLPAGGYMNDCLRVGDASSGDAGTGTAINIENITINGFTFTQSRIGLWVVYARNVLIENIRGEGVAVLAVGNDADDECEDVHINGVTRTGAYSGTFFTVGLFRVSRYSVSKVTSVSVVSGNAITIHDCNEGRVFNNLIDQVDQVNTGIELFNFTSGRDNLVYDNIIKNCVNGITTFGDDPASQTMRALISDNILVNNSVALNVEAKNTYFIGNITEGSTTTIRFGGDASGNVFKSNSFSENAVSDPFSVRSLNTFENNLGLTIDLPFTPSLTFGGASTGITGTFTGLARIENKLVTAKISITLTSKGSSTGEARIVGLPYLNGTFLGSVKLMYHNNYASGFDFQSFVDAGVSSITLGKGGLAGFATQSDTDWTDTTRVDLYIEYTAD